MTINERHSAPVQLRLPGGLESTSQVARQIASLGEHGLTLADLRRYAAQVPAVTAADVQRVARKYLAPDAAVVVMVGDLAGIHAGIEALNLGPITVMAVGSLVR